MTAAPWSLRGRLTATLGAATLLIWCASSFWLYRVAFDAANRLFDAALDNTAQAVLAVVRNEAAELTETKEGVGFELAVIDQSNQTDTIYQVLGPNGIMVFRSHGAPIAPLAAAQSRGFGITRIAGRDYRVFTLATELHAATIHVAQPISRRIELARAGAIRLQIPGAVLMLALIGAVAWSVREATAPIISYANALDSLSPEAETPVDGTGLPRELQPVARAIDRLIGRVHDSIVRERTLTADAAHELRNPLAALRLQAQVALRATGKKERDAALNELLLGTDRAARMVDAVLTLARFDTTTGVDLSKNRVHLDQLAQLVAAEFAPLATMRGVTIRVVCEQVTVLGDQDALAILLRNLLSNALRHARRQIRVEISESHQRAAIAVQDDGPGFSEESSARAFHRFFRGPELSNTSDGAGLGLALVLRIAQLHSGGVEIGRGPYGGARVTVTLRCLCPEIPSDNDEVQTVAASVDRAISE
jgi:signal transduction histidine kinase